MTSKAQHKHYNNLLNGLKTSPHQPTPTPLTYAHHYLVDSFYTTSDREKVRVTRDEKTGTMLECMRKIRLGNLDVYSPKRAADWRISVNLEIPSEHPFSLAEWCS
jgi:polynucleotide 5'-triphosphatase